MTYFAGLGPANSCRNVGMAGGPMTRIRVKHPPEKAKASRWPIAPEEHQADEKEGVKGDQTDEH
jgi:hypothetical protein